LAVVWSRTSNSDYSTFSLTVAGAAVIWGLQAAWLAVEVVFEVASASRKVRTMARVLVGGCWIVVVLLGYECWGGVCQINNKFMGWAVGLLSIPILPYGLLAGLLSCAVWVAVWSGVDFAVERMLRSRREAASALG
jgi:hypothetical protein